MKIFFDNTQSLGDTALALKPLFVIKQLYPNDTLIMLTNGLGKSLYRNCEFIDEILTENEDYARDDKFKRIGENDILILINSDGRHISLAKQSKCQCIITFVRPRNFYSPRFRLSWLIHKFFKEESAQILSLVRLIDKKHYDKHIKSIDFSKCTFATDKKNESQIRAFLSHINLSYQKIININIFCHTAASYNFQFDDWCAMISSLAREFKDFLFVLTNYEGNAIQFSEFKEKNIAVFVNNADLLNLVALSKHFSLCISVSTGNIHIARALRIPCLALYPNKDKIRYAGDYYGRGGGRHLMCLSLKPNGAVNMSETKTLFLKKCAGF